MVRGVLFDLDGVLVRTDVLHRRAWEQITAEENIPFDAVLARRLLGLGRMESLAAVLEAAPRAYSPAERTALAERKNAIFQRWVQGLTPADVVPGARRLLDELRGRGMRTAIGSSSRNARAIADRLELTALFDAVIDGNDLTHFKPHPEVFLLAAGRLALRPRECVVVEDAAAGIEAAHAAGMRVLGLGKPETLPGADGWARRLKDVSVETLLTVGSHGATE